jgi:hypothetical protein
MAGEAPLAPVESASVRVVGVRRVEAPVVVLVRVVGEIAEPLP